MKKLLKWIDKAVHPARHWEPFIKTLMARVDHLEKELNKHTVVHCDYHANSESLVIVVGQYRNNDYVRMFSVPPTSLHDLIEHLRYVEKNSQVGRFDIQPGFHIESVYPWDRF
jgi:hypothetical protein